MNDDFDALLAAFHDQPFSKMRRDVLADWCEEYGDEQHRLWAPILRAKRWPLTLREVLAVQTLASCRFAPATWDKKMAANISFTVLSESDWYRKFDCPSLTIKQMLWTWILLWRYRRSVGSKDLIAEAEKRYNRCVELLDVKHLKPIRVTKGSVYADMRTTLFDDLP